MQPQMAWSLWYPSHQPQKLSDYKCNYQCAPESVMLRKWSFPIRCDEKFMSPILPSMAAPEVVIMATSRYEKNHQRDDISVLMLTHKTQSVLTELTIYLSVAGFMPYIMAVLAWLLKVPTRQRPATGGRIQRCHSRTVESGQDRVTKWKRSHIAWHWITYFWQCI